MRKQMHDFQLICRQPGHRGNTTIALVASEEIPMALCYDCGSSCDVIDSGAHDSTNYPINDEREDVTE